jgi:signal transduction histidine kinase
MTARRLAWVLCALTGLACVLHAVCVLGGSEHLTSRTSGLSPFPIITVGSFLGAVVGALVATRHPRNPIGWLFLVGQLGTAVGLAAGSYAWRVLRDGDLGPLWTGQQAGRVANILSGGWAFTVLAIVFLLFPDGLLPSRRWRPVLWGLALVWLATAVAAVMSVPLDKVVVGEETKFGPVAEVVNGLLNLMQALLVLCAIVALVSRRRRARGEQRQQLRWLAAAAGAVAVGLVVLLARQVIQPAGVPVWLGDAPLYLSYTSVPVAAGVAILRYRLYDIDIILNRAVVGAVLVAFVTVGYVVVVVVLGAVVGSRVSDSFWASVAATACVALAFQPLRRAVHRLGDRVVYGRRAAPYEALAHFSGQLAHSVSIDEVLPQVAESSAHSVGAAQAYACLFVPGAADVLVTWPADSRGPAPEYAVDVWQGEQRLGWIAVTMPAGHRLGAGERSLLDDLAAQAGLGFRNARLTAELRARIEEESRSAVELAASRRRLLAAQESQRRRVTGMIEDEVLPHLSALGPVLTSAARACPARPEAVRECLDSAATITDTALESLREIVRGVFPPVLARKGLAAALSAVADRSGGRISLTFAPAALNARLDPHIEAVAYFCVVEWIRGLAEVRVQVDLPPEWLVLTVLAAGPAPLRRVDHQQIIDRVRGCGGEVSLEQDEDERPHLRARLPALQLA